SMWSSDHRSHRPSPTARGVLDATQVAVLSPPETLETDADRLPSRRAVSEQVAALGSDREHGLFDGGLLGKRPFCEAAQERELALRESGLLRRVGVDACDIADREQVPCDGNEKRQGLQETVARLELPFPPSAAGLEGLEVLLDLPADAVSVD